MWIYLHADSGTHLSADREQLKGFKPGHLTMMRVGIGAWNVDDVVSRLADRGVTTLILPDQYTRHSKDMDRVKQCAILMDRAVMPLTHFLRQQALKTTANPSALAGQPRLPVAEGAAQATA